MDNCDDTRQNETETDILVQQYIDQLTPLEKKACQIAKEELKTSFNLSRSNGFIAWKKQQNDNIPNIVDK